MLGRRINRRTMLQGLGAVIALPGLEAMSHAAPAAAKPPARMLVAHFGTGMNVREFFPEAAGKECKLPRILRPLEKFRERMTVLSGTHLQHGGGHTGDYSFLTGAEGWTSSGIKSSISADQIVAQEIGQATRFASLQMSIERGTNFGQQGLATLSWSPDGIPLAADNDPHRIFNQLFQVDDEAAVAAREAGFRRRGSILDFVQGQAKQMAPRVSQSDKRKLDEYFSSVREIEKQLQRDIDWSTKPKPKPTLPGLGDYSLSLTPSTDGFDYAAYQRLMYDLITIAFQTDSTRVITYNVRRELAGGVFPVHGVSKGFHSLTHHNNDPKNLDELAKVDQINMGFWRHLLERLESVEESDGRSLLEHSTVAFSSGAGMDHSRDRLPTVVFGGEALGFQHQTHVELPEKTPLARVWHTMAESVGAHRESMQDSTGPIDEIYRAG